MTDISISWLNTMTAGDSKVLAANMRPLTTSNQHEK